MPSLLFIGEDGATREVTIYRLDMMAIVNAVAAVYAAVLGLLLGSFIGLAADRLPRGESIVRPRSRCRACGRRLSALDLVPVIGYLARGGRCASCGVPIGPWAPLLEAATAAILAVPVIWLGVWPGLPAAILLELFWGAGVVALGYRLQRRAGNQD